MQACTIVARNYLPQARVLARSFQEHHPDCPFTVLVMDETAPRPGARDSFMVLGLNDLELAPGEVERMALIYNVLEFSTAVKPWLLRRLLRSGPNVVLYFDPDIEIFASLSDLASLARAHSIVLTPHVLEPIPRDGLRPTESNIMGAGIYNLGFIAVGPGSEDFLDWWAIRLRRESIVDPGHMRFTDQRWIDFVPALFPHHILRDPACNVAYWNLDQRKFTRAGAGYEVNGRPLRFFHYSGYEPDRPEMLSKFQGDAPRVSLQSEPALAVLCGEYGRKLIAEGYAQSRLEPYGYDSCGDGLPVDFAMRRLYRAALMKFETGEGPEPPNPFYDGTENAFLEWLNQPLDSATALITRYMLGVWNVRPDVQTAFPDPLGRGAAAFHEWFTRTGRAEAEPALLPRVNPALALLRFDALKALQCVLGRAIDFGASGDSERYRLSGWSRPEQHFTWSLGGAAHLGLPVPAQAESLELRVLTGAFIHRPDLTSQQVEVYAQGRKVADWSVGEPSLYRAAIPGEAMDDSGILIIEFRTPDAASPRRLLRDSQDSRVLGLCVYQLRLVRTTRLRRALSAIFSRRPKI